MTISSSATRMFEEKVGEKEIYDFTLGNPEIETPAKFTEELKCIVNNPFPGMHCYTPLAGYTKTREAIAKTLSKEHGLSFSAQHVIMTAGFINAPALMQQVITNLQGVHVDISEYQERRDFFSNTSKRIG